VTGPLAKTRTAACVKAAVKTARFQGGGATFQYPSGCASRDRPGGNPAIHKNPGGHELPPEMREALRRGTAVLVAGTGCGELCGQPGWRARIEGLAAALPTRSAAEVRALLERDAWAAALVMARDRLGTASGPGGGSPDAGRARPPPGCAGGPGLGALASGDPPPGSMTAGRAPWPPPARRPRSCCAGEPLPPARGRPLIHVFGRARPSRDPVPGAGRSARQGRGSRARGISCASWPGGVVPLRRLPAVGSRSRLAGGARPRPRRAGAPALLRWSRRDRAVRLPVSAAASACGPSPSRCRSTPGWPPWSAPRWRRWAPSGRSNTSWTRRTPRRGHPRSRRRSSINRCARRSTATWPNSAGTSAADGLGRLVNPRARPRGAGQAPARAGPGAEGPPPGSGGRHPGARARARRRSRPGPGLGRARASAARGRRSGGPAPLLRARPAHAGQARRSIAGPALWSGVAEVSWSAPPRSHHGDGGPSRRCGRWIRRTRARAALATLYVKLGPTVSDKAVAAYQSLAALRPDDPEPYACSSGCGRRRIAGEGRLGLGRAGAAWGTATYPEPSRRHRCGRLH
jgi:hypothetical protein